MLDKCANPACSAILLRLRDGGRLFEIKVDANHPSSGDILIKPGISGFAVPVAAA